MGDAFTTYWSAATCTSAGEAMERALPLSMLLGGHHTSMPSYARAKVAAGDVVYPVTVRRRQLYVLGRMSVSAVLPLDEQTPGPGKALYLHRFPGWAFLDSRCATDVVIGDGEPLRWTPVPPDVVQRLSYRSQRRVRPLRHVTGEGEITHVVGLTGIYRLTQDSASELDRVWQLASSPA